MKNAAGIIDHSFETFHEIIYGKSERGANERRVFFLVHTDGTRME
jgi:hypothetical protein